MKRKFSSRRPALTILLLAFTCSCSDEDGGATESAVGSTMDRGAGGSLAAAGSGGSTSSGGASGTEVGGSNGLAPGGSNGNVGQVSQGGGAGTGMGGAGGSAGAGALVDAGAADSGAAAVSYAKDIQPILLARCSPCHSTDNDGRHNAASSYADAVRVSARIVREISSGGMPESGSGNQGCNGGDPGDPGCVSAAEFELIQRWVASGTPQ